MTAPSGFEQGLCTADRTTGTYPETLARARLLLGNGARPAVRSRGAAGRLRLEGQDLRQRTPQRRRGYRRKVTVEPLIDGCGVVEGAELGHPDLEKMLRRPRTAANRMQRLV